MARKQARKKKPPPKCKAAAVPGGVITSDQSALPPNCYIVPMVILEKPIPLPKDRKKKR